MAKTENREDELNPWTFSNSLTFLKGFAIPCSPGCDRIYLISYEKELAKQYRKSNSLLILDVGCGFSGSHPIWKRDLRAHGMVNIEIVGLDLNPHVLTEKGSIHGDGGNLPIKDQSIDVVVAEFVLMHLDALAPSLGLTLRREARRVLKEGGLFACLC
jgi:ubiquinone/menaquinone biosynthesis C-methylase UbiE